MTIALTLHCSTVHEHVVHYEAFPAVAFSKFRCSVHTVMTTGKMFNVSVCPTAVAVQWGSRHFLEVKANKRWMAPNLCLSALGMARTDLCNNAIHFQ